jgi:hypothetical protein
LEVLMLPSKKRVKCQVLSGNFMVSGARVASISIGFFT